MNLKVKYAFVGRLRAGADTGFRVHTPNVFPLFMKFRAPPPFFVGGGGGGS